MASTDRWSALFWFFFSLFATYESYELGLGVLHEPGPGFLYFWTGIVVAVLSLVVIVKSLMVREGQEVEEVSFTRYGLVRVSCVLCALVLYALTVEWLGFIIVSLLLFIFILGVVEKKGWLFTCLVSLLVTVLAYLVFETALQSQLPEGPSGEIILLSRGLNSGPYPS